MTKKIAIVSIILVCLLAAWICSEMTNSKAVRPPAGATNLIAFLEARPQFRGIHKFEHNQKMYLEVIGEPSQSALSLPSGSPAYIFDGYGALVDWCRDLGDQPSFARKWGGFSNAVLINPEEARQLVKPLEH